MNLRLATKNDLPYLNKMYSNIVKDMHEKNINLWNEFYPSCEFSDDIEKKSLYVLDNGTDILASFVLFKDPTSSNKFKWTDKNADAMYIARIGVNVNFLRQGLGGMVINFAKDIAKKQGCKYLRLDVADINYAAIKLYEKHGFIRVPGKHSEYIKERDFTLNEYGYEIKL